MATPTITPDALTQAVISTLPPQINEANELAAQIAQHDTDPNVLISQLRDDEATEYEQVKKYQEWRAKIDAQIEDNTKKIDAWLRENALPKPGEDGEVDVAALKAQHGEKRKKIQSAFTYLGTMGVTESDLSDLPKLKTLRGTTASTSGQSGIKRPRFSAAFVNGEAVFDTKPGKTEGETVHVINFTILAAKLSKMAKSGTVTSETLRSHVYEMAGTNDLTSVESGKDFTWDQVIGDDNFTVKVVF